MPRGKRREKEVFGKIIDYTENCRNNVPTHRLQTAALRGIVSIVDRIYSSAGGGHTSHGVSIIIHRNHSDSIKDYNKREHEKISMHH